MKGRIMEYIYRYKSPLGRITLASDGEFLTGLWFDGQKLFAKTLESENCEKNLPVFDETAKWLDVYFSGREPDFTPPILIKETEFCKAVCEIMLKIPYGKTTTYGEIAREIAAQRGRAKMSAQAVGSAVGRNPVSLIVPCHRVVGSDGSLTGYAGGIELKRKLLTLEKSDLFFGD